EVEQGSAPDIVGKGLSSPCACFLSVFFFSSRRRHTRSKRDWSSDVCSSDLRPRGCAGCLRAGRRARAPQHPGALRSGNCARPAQSPGRRYADVSPLAGGRRRVIRVVVDDLAFLAATAVVRPATTRLDPTTPAGRRLETVGGTAFTHGLQLQ